MSYIRSDLVNLASSLKNRLLLSLVIITISMGMFVLPAQATAVYEIPVVSAGVPTWVVDKAEVLSLSTKGTVRGTLEQLAKQTGKEVRFVTIHRLDYGDTIQVFTDKLFKKWFAKCNLDTPLSNFWEISIGKLVVLGIFFDSDLLADMAKK